MNIKELRTKHGFTQKKLAEMLRTTQQTVGRWESGRAEPSLSALRDLAMIFGCSVDELLGRDPTASPETLRVSTPFAHLIDEKLDGYWGNIGVLLHGMEHTIWYPISTSQAGYARQAMSRWETELPWFTVITLNNRILLLNPNVVRRIWLLDEACDSPDDWTLLGDGVEGWPLELYRGLSAWVDYGDGVGSWESETSPVFRGIVEEYLQREGLDHEGARARVHNTHIYERSGNKISYFAEGEDVYTAISLAEGSSEPPVMFRIDGWMGVFESSFPANNVALIDAPLIDFIDAMKEERGEE